MELGLFHLAPCPFKIQDIIFSDTGPWILKYWSWGFKFNELHAFLGIGDSNILIGHCMYTSIILGDGHYSPSTEFSGPFKDQYFRIQGPVSGKIISYILKGCTCILCRLFGCTCISYRCLGAWCYGWRFQRSIEQCHLI